MPISTIVRRLAAGLAILCVALPTAVVQAAGEGGGPYLTFIPLVRGCGVVPPTPTPPPPEPGDDWEAVTSWVYQLSGYRDDRLDQIAGSAFDLAVVDLARDGYLDYFSAAEVAAVRSTGKIVLAYFEIGAIESYRPEWDDVPNDLKLGAVGGWPDEQYVAYWDEAWWPIVKGRVDQAISAGFDGAYLDMIVTYEEIPAGSAGTDRDDLAQKMVDLIARLSDYAKARRPGFRVVPQNSPELHEVRRVPSCSRWIGRRGAILPGNRPGVHAWLVL